MFFTLLAAPIILMRGVRVVESHLTKAAQLVQERRRLEGMTEDPVIAKVEIPAYVLVEPAGLEKVRQELKVLCGQHPASHALRLAQMAGLVVQCPQCSAFRSATRSICPCAKTQGNAE